MKLPCSNLAGLAASVVVALVVAAPAPAPASPLRKVVVLLEEMKSQVEKEQSQDEANNAKHECWCESNEKAKDAAVKAAEVRIGELAAVIEEAAGSEGQLKTEIVALAAGVAEDQDSLATAAAVREKEAADAAAESTDAKECIATLDKALEVLSKVQMLQRQGRATEVRQSLVQVKDALLGIHGQSRFRKIMQQDLWDVMGAIENTAADAGVFLPPVSRKSLSTLDRRAGHLRSAQPTGAAAGASSYSSRSNSIVGVLSQVKDDFVSSLMASMKAEHEALAEFHGLRAAKEAEIAAGSAQQAAKEKALADSLVKAANAKEETEATKASLSADQQLLLELTSSCKSAGEAFAERQKVRGQEIQALGETLAILAEDDARDLFGKTINFMQIGNDHAWTAGRQGKAVAVAKTGAASKAADSAMRRILGVARRQKNWVLASLAVHIRLDAFVKVKEAMDKMTGELKAQQAAEVEKLDACKKDIDEIEDSLKVAGNDKEDLEAVQLQSEGSIGELSGQLDALGEEYAELQVSLKAVGEQRKTENELFRQSVADQRAAIAVLHKAMERLRAFYAQKKSMLQVAAQQPPAAKAYEKSGGAGGVIQLMDKIITEATSAEAEMVKEEQHAQEAYAALVTDSGASVDANRASVAEKTKLLEEAKGQLSAAKAALLENGDKASKLGNVLKGMHLECDFLLEHYDVRQQARQEEMDAIAEAKAILSGAGYMAGDEE